MDSHEPLGNRTGACGLGGGKFFVIVDTVGNCFVVQSTPNTALSLVPAPVRCPGSPGHLSLGE
jgi:hypothetical protein